MDDPKVIAAVIAALASIGAAGLAAFAALRAKRSEQAFTRAEKTEQRRWEALSTLDKYREPLVAAADDLGHRINNIRHNDFFVWYLNKDERRRDLALLTTLFRFAKYFGWIELVERETHYLHFEDGNTTAAIMSRFNAVGIRFADDTLDPEPLSSIRSARLMLWREEQRAIGELMQSPGGVSPGVKGFASFVQDYEDLFAKWFECFTEDLQWSRVKASDRLFELQKNLAALVCELDTAGLYKSSKWLAETAKEGEVNTAAVGA